MKHKYINIYCSSQEELDELNKFFNSGDLPMLWNDDITHVGIHCEDLHMYWGDKRGGELSVEKGEPFFTFEEAMENPDRIHCIIKLST